MYRESSATRGAIDEIESDGLISIRACSKRVASLSSIDLKLGESWVSVSLRQVQISDQASNNGRVAVASNEEISETSVTTGGRELQVEPAWLVNV